MEGGKAEGGMAEGRGKMEEVFFLIPDTSYFILSSIDLNFYLLS